MLFGDEVVMAPLPIIVTPLLKARVPVTLESSMVWMLMSMAALEFEAAGMPCSASKVVLVSKQADSTAPSTLA